jgi:hypothetical protein
MFASWLLLLALGPQSRQATEVDQTITVQGVPATDLQRRARDVVRAIEPEEISGQLPRWNDPICPAVVGLSPALAERIVRRVRQVATDVGAPVAKPECRSNLVVTFTADARDLTARLNRRNARLVEATSPGAKRMLLDSDAPVRWWYLRRPEGADGRPLTASSAAANAAMMMGECPGGPCPSTLPSGDNSFYLDGARNSMIGSSFRVSIGLMNIVVDVHRAEGKTLDAVTDYVAMVALSGARFLPRPAPAPSVLNLFGDAGATAMTDWDMAYLKATYKVRANASARSQRAAMAGYLLRELTKPSLAN